ncbi:MAG: GNAT family N-acetyltransferase, partial [Bacteroidetes bacterium]
MNITKVTDKKEQKEFTKTAKIIYKDDPVWVCPMDKQIDAVFDPK